MPNGETLEEKVNAAEEAPKPETPGARGGSIFDSIGSSIDSLIGTIKAIPSAIKEGVKQAAYYTYYGAKAAVGLVAGVAIAGTTHALILPVGMAAGAWLANKKNKKETTFKQIANELAVGGILGGVLHHMFAGVKYIGDAVKAAYGTLASLITKAGVGLATIPPFLATHEYLNRALIKDYKPQPLNIGKKLKKMWPIIPPVIANFSVVPEFLGPAYQMPIAAGIATAYGLLKGEKKKEEKTEAPQPQPYALPKAA